MLIVIVALGLLVSVLLVSRVNHLKDHNQLKEKLKVVQEYADQAAKTNLGLEATNKLLGSEIIKLKEAQSNQKSGQVPPTRTKKTKVA